MTAFQALFRGRCGSCGIWPCLVYLSFAIASEIGLSGTDLGSCFAGAVLIVAAISAVNLVPSGGRLVSVAVYLALPTLFTIHALMLFAALVNAALLTVIKVVG